MKPRFSSFLKLVPCLMLAGCEPQYEEQQSDSRIKFELEAKVRTRQLAELSGLEVVEGPLLVAHNDDGKPDLFVIGRKGEIVARYRLQGVRNRDWEDLTQLEVDGRKLLAVGDIGDNLGRFSSIRLHFVALPERIVEYRAGDRAEGKGAEIPLEIEHSINVGYPDGSRDCEAMAYDSASGQILFLTKRDMPPRVYALDARTALNEDHLELQFLGTVPNLRPPTRSDQRVFGRNTRWISQPTGMDIDADGRLAAVITYRSLYLFERRGRESWRDAFFGAPREFLGPQSLDEEAIAFSPDMKSLYISSEGTPAPIYHVLLPEQKTTGD